MICLIPNVYICKTLVSSVQASDKGNTGNETLVKDISNDDYDDGGRNEK